MLENVIMLDSIEQNTKMIAVGRPRTRVSKTFFQCFASMFFHPSVSNR